MVKIKRFIRLDAFGFSWMLSRSGRFNRTAGLKIGLDGFLGLDGFKRTGTFSGSGKFFRVWTKNGFRIKRFLLKQETGRADLKGIGSFDDTKLRLCRAVSNLVR